MNIGGLQSSVMQQMMMGSENPNWWNSNNHSSLPFPSNSFYHLQHHFPDSWSQLLLGDVVGEEDQKGCMPMFQQAKKLEDWDEEILNGKVDVKKHHSPHSINYGYGQGGVGVGVGVVGDDYQLAPKQNWSPMIPASSPHSCIPSFSSNMLDFSNNNNNHNNSPTHHSRPTHPQPDRSSECNSNPRGGAMKKSRVESSSNQTSFKVRKEKLGDRITALHQLVSPFGKTDTASVLLEAIGYIRFLHTQIEALSLPYLGNASGSTRQQEQHSVPGERNCMFPEDPGQLVNDNGLNKNGVSHQDEEGEKDLRGRGLCLVPVSCTLQVGSENGADYWAPTFGGGGGFR
ncbi:transcription factor bHLH68-like isoform X1 [Cucurbita maxima]|uniref:Transcription factor bHLH68-like isoform X1 n=1 Tax=Cucurbita maxima TaxID=3661 RepID=A0A6J1JBA3_CUCMA|nr:transcription factor bHLH68-like isoform X1 [Cucurbita maxima]